MPQDIHRPSLVRSIREGGWGTRRCSATRFKHSLAFDSDAYHAAYNPGEVVVVYCAGNAALRALSERIGRPAVFRPFNCWLASSSFSRPIAIGSLGMDVMIQSVASAARRWSGFRSAARSLAPPRIGFSSFLQSSLEQDLQILDRLRSLCPDAGVTVLSEVDERLMMMFG